MPNLTDQAIRSATDGETIWDDSLKGFGLRAGKRRKTFVVLIASGRRQAIGQYPLISLADARKEAKRILAEKTLGKVRPTHTAFDDAKAEFLADCEKRIKPRTVHDYTRILGSHFRFGRKSVADITPREVLKILNGMSNTPAERHHAFSVASAFFNWCRKQHIIDRSPLEDIGAPAKPSSRDRVLSNDEVRTLLTALNTDTTAFKRICLLLLYTGQRRGEIAALEWDWINEEEQTITLPGSITKNGHVHAFPYGDAVKTALASIPRIKDCPYVFPAARQMNEKTTIFNGWSKPKAQLDKELVIEPWRIHDLRRTVSSGMAALGVPIHVTEKLLNHVSGTLSGVAGIYNRHRYMDEMREAVLQWEAFLNKLKEPRA